jgi:hypothetical protein
MSKPERMLIPAKSSRQVAAGSAGIVAAAIHSGNNTTRPGRLKVGRLNPPVPVAGYNQYRRAELCAVGRALATESDAARRHAAAWTGTAADLTRLLHLAGHDVNERTVRTHQAIECACARTARLQAAA